jgi:lipopolysaccharide transport system ATP-binding protein
MVSRTAPYSLALPGSTGHIGERAILRRNIFAPPSLSGSTLVIRGVNLSKIFRLYKQPADRLKELIINKSYHIDHQALKDVSFEVKNGKALGIIGCNGAGKSTLLKILTGVLLPDSGHIEIDGKITGLLELGTGFNYELTGLQNIHNNGLLLNMTPDEIEAKRDAIVEFSELGEFIQEPIKTYSSGMVMRLAFAIAISAEPNCFVVDEALSVGDAHFQQKCMRRIKEFRADGGSIIFVSHDSNAIKMLCDQVLLLDKGHAIEEGRPDLVVNAYNFLIAKMNETEAVPIVRREKNMAYGTMEAEIVAVKMEGKDSRSSMLSSGEIAVITTTIRPYVDIEDATVGFLIRDKYSQDIFGTNTFYLNQTLAFIKQREYLVTFKVQINLGPGKYTLTAAIHTNENHAEKCFHWYDYVADFEVAGIYGEPFTGICRLYPEVSVAEKHDYVCIG